MDYEGLILSATVSFNPLHPPSVRKNSCSLLHCAVLPTSFACPLLAGLPFGEQNGACMAHGNQPLFFKPPLHSMLLSSLEKSPKLFFCWIVAQQPDSGLCMNGEEPVSFPLFPPSILTFKFLSATLTVLAPASAVTSHQFHVFISHWSTLVTGWARLIRQFLLRNKSLHLPSSSFRGEQYFLGWGNWSQWWVINSHQCCPWLTVGTQWLKKLWMTQVLVVLPTHAVLWGTEGSVHKGWGLHSVT